MNCAEYQKVINRFIDHEVRATESGGMFEHLGKCGECQEFYDTVTKIGDALEKTESLNIVAQKPHWKTGMSDREPVTENAGARKQERVRAITLVAVIVLVAGLFWTTTIPNGKESRFEFARELSQTGMPQFQP